MANSGSSAQSSLRFSVTDATSGNGREETSDSSVSRGAYVAVQPRRASGQMPASPESVPESLLPPMGLSSVEGLHVGTTACMQPTTSQPEMSSSAQTRGQRMSGTVVEVHAISDASVDTVGHSCQTVDLTADAQLPDAIQVDESSENDVKYMGSTHRPGSAVTPRLPRRQSAARSGSRQSSRGSRTGSATPSGAQSYGKVRQPSKTRQPSAENRPTPP